MLNTRGLSAESILEALSDAVNGPERQMREAIKPFMFRLHPTLQQCLIRSVVKPMLEALTEEHTDGRNEASARFAKAALEATKDIGLPLI